MIKFIRLLSLALMITMVSNAFEATAQKIALDAKWYEKLQSDIESKDIEQLISRTENKLQEAKDIERNDLVSQYLKELAWIHLNRTKDLEKAMAYSVNALEIDEKYSLNDQQLYTYLLLSQIFIEVDDYFNAAEFTQKALEINRSINDENLQIKLKQQLGDIYTQMASYNKAQEQYENVLAYAKSSRYPKLEADNWYQIGQLEYIQQNFQLAINAYLNALKIHRRINDMDEEAKTLLAIGNSYRKMDNYDRSLENYKVALNIWRSLENPKGLAKIYNALGNLFIHNKEYERAIANLKFAVNNAQLSQDQELLIEAYHLISEAHKGTGNYKAAFEYQELKNALEDFILNEKNDRQILKMQNRYTIGQQQNTIDQLEFNRIQKDNELAAETRKNEFLTILSILAVVIVALIFILLISQRSNNRKLKVAKAEVDNKNKLLQESNATKDKFFSIISHDLKGPLNSLTSFSGLLMNHTESLSKEEIQMLAADLDKSLKNLFALLENLLQWSRSQTGNIDFKKEAIDLTEIVHKNKDLLEKQAGNKSIQILFEQEKSVLAFANEQSIDTVVRNLLSNAIKFTEENGKIKMGISEDEKYHYIKVADNGVGMSPQVAESLFKLDTKHSTKGTANEKGTGLGLILCKEFVEKNGGTLKVKSEEGKGSLFYFSIPKQKA